MSREYMVDQLCKTSDIFEYSLLSFKSAVSACLRAYAIQNFISSKTISIIQWRYFAESTTAVKHSAELQTMNFILNAISEIQLANSSQELFWQLTTIDKLDHLDSHDHFKTFNISTKSDELDIVQAILSKLRYFQNPSEHRLRVKLTAIANLTIMIWSALRRDSCRVHLNYEPSTDDRQRWDFVHYQPANSSNVVNSPSETFTAKLPSKSFVVGNDENRKRYCYPCD